MFNIVDICSRLLSGTLAPSVLSFTEQKSLPWYHETYRFFALWLEVLNCHWRCPCTWVTKIFYISFNSCFSWRDFTVPRFLLCICHPEGSQCWVWVVVSFISYHRRVLSFIECLYCTGRVPLGLPPLWTALRVSDVPGKTPFHQVTFLWYPLWFG